MRSHRSRNKAKNPNLAAKITSNRRQLGIARIRSNSLLKTSFFLAKDLLVGFSYKTYEF